MANTNGNRIGGNRDAFTDDNSDDTALDTTPQAVASRSYALTNPKANKPDIGAIDKRRTKFNLVHMGFEIAENITEEELLNQVRVLDDITKEDFWYWGDIAWAAERHGWDHLYKEIEKITKIPVETLGVYAWLSRSILPILRGIAGVKKSHYKLIAHLKPAEQEQWINRIVEGNWSVRQLTAALAGKNIPPTPLPRTKSSKKPSAYAQTADKLAKFESGAGGYRSKQDVRKAIADQRRWLDDLEKTL